MNYKRKSFHIYLCLSLVITLGMALVYHFASFFSYNYSGSVVSLSEMVSEERSDYDGEILSEYSNSSYNTYTVYEGETQTLYCAIPYIAEEPVSPTLMFVSYCVKVEVYYEDELIYSFGELQEEEGGFIGKNLNYIPITKDMIGNEVCIKITSLKRRTTFNTKTFNYGDMNDVVRFYIQRRTFAILISCFLIIFGILLVFIQPFISENKRLRFETIVYSLIFFDLGFYYLAYNDLLIFFIPIPEVITYIEYMALYIMPVLLHFSMLANKFISKVKFEYVLAVIEVLFVFLIFILSITGVICVYDPLLIFHVMFGAEGLYIFVKFINSFIAFYRKDDDIVSLSDDLPANTAMFGIICFVLSVFFELIRWNINDDSFLGGNNDVKGPAIIVGALILVGMIIASYFFHAAGNINDAATRKKLEGLAYTDLLTGISNRAGCDILMDRAWRHNRDYIIISIDLDGLKKVNDNLGHQQGDLMISGFANLLKEVFNGVKLIGRMGGDEFIVMIYTLDVAWIETLLHSLEKMAEEENEKLTAFKYRFSYGFASNHEVADKNVKQTYMLADSRMYRMKEQHHKEQGEM